MGIQIHELTALNRAPQTGDVLAVDTGTTTNKVDYSALRGAVLTDAVRTDDEQNLTDAQKAQAIENIGAATQADVTAIEDEIGNTALPTTAQTITGAIAEVANGAVRYDIAQSLTSSEQIRARNNIGAANGAEQMILVQNYGKCLRFNEQTLTESQKTQARTNIGAASEADTDALETLVGNTTLPTTAQTVTGAIAEHETDISGINSAIGTVPSGSNLQGEVDDLKSALENLNPITEDVKTALLDCFEHVAWIDEHGQDYYDALEAALYTETGLVSISAVFTQGSAVIYPSTPLNDLKEYLVVTEYYNNGTSKTTTDYSLSGVLEVGTSTITVSKGGKTTTFTVTVSSPYWDYEWDADSGVAPDYFDAYEYNFTSYPDAMYVDNFYIDFDYVGDVDILFVAKMADNAYQIPNRTPQISIRTAQSSSGYNGFKVVYQTPSSKVETNLSGSFESTNINYTDYHEYRAKYENGTGYLWIDGVLAEQGPGVTNNQYIYMTGIFGSTMDNQGHPDTSNSLDYTRMSIKCIKYKELS